MKYLPIILFIMSLFCGACYSTGKRIFDIKVGEKVKITLNENGTTGYRVCWLNQKHCSAISLTKEDAGNDLIGKLKIMLEYDGVGGDRSFVFVGKKIGTDTLTFSRCPVAIEKKPCQAFANDSTPVEDTYIISVSP
ncbi:MAG: protease inhibitor I42 family protein [Bacteroidia bacterium]